MMFRSYSNTSIKGLHVCNHSNDYPFTFTCYFYVCNIHFIFMCDDMFTNQTKTGIPLVFI